MLRCQAIIDRQRPCLRRSPDSRDHRAMRDDGSDHVPTPMQVENDAVAGHSWRHDPFRRHPVHRHRLALDVARHALADLLHERAPALDRGVRILRLRRYDLDYLLKLLAGHALDSSINQLTAFLRFLSLALPPPT